MKRTIALLLATLMIIMSIPVGAFELSSPESAGEQTERTAETAPVPDEALLFAAGGSSVVWENDFEDAATFASNTQVRPSAYDNSYLAGIEKAYLFNAQSCAVRLTQADDPLDAAETDKNQVMQVALNPTGWRMVGMTFPDKLTKPGVYTMQFDMYCPSRTSWLHRWYASDYVNDQGMTTPSFTCGSSAWKTVSTSYTVGYTKEQVVDELAPVNSSGYKDYQGNTITNDRLAYLLNQIWPFYNNTSASDTYVYLDNFKLLYTPYADVTFVLDTASLPTDTSKRAEVLAAAAASMAATEHTASDAAEPILHRAYKPGDKLPKAYTFGTGWCFAGWSDTNSDAVGSTTAAAGTKTLYAVYREMPAAEVAASASMTRAGKGGTVTFTNIGDAADFTVDLGNTNATYTVNGNTVTVTAGTRAGYVTVTAGGDGMLPSSAELLIYGSAEEVPGLNLLNGTPDPYGFDEQLSDVVTAGTLIDDPDVPGNKYIQYTNSSSAYTGFNIELAQHSGRPYSIGFRRKSQAISGQNANTATWWTSNSNKMPSVSGSATEWATYTWTNVSAPESSHFTFNHKNNGNDASGATHYDWYDDMYVMPWYKVTYHFSDNSTSSEFVDPKQTSFLPAAKTEASTWNGNTYHHFKGWATSADGDALAVIPLHYADLDLYPVYEDITMYSNTSYNGHPMLDESKGVLAVAQTFDEPGATEKSASFTDKNYVSSISNLSSDGWLTSKGVVNDDVTEGNRAIKLAGEKSGAYRFTRFGYTIKSFTGSSTYTSNSGTVSVNYDIRFDDDFFYDSNGDGIKDKSYVSSGNHASRLNSGDHTDAVVSSGLANTTSVDALKAWQTASISTRQVGGTTNGIVNNFSAFHLWYSVSSSTPTPNTLYIDNIYLYYYPKSAFMFKTNGDLTFVDTNGEAYIMPSPADIDSTLTECDAWKDGNGFLYTPGETYTYDMLSQRTLTPIVSYVPAVLKDTTKGYLVLEQDYEQDSAATPAYLDPHFAKSTLSDGYDNASASITADPDDSENHVLKITGGTSAGYHYFRVSVRMTEDAKYAMDYDLKLASTSDMQKINNVEYRFPTPSVSDPGFNQTPNGYALLQAANTGSTPAFAHLTNTVFSATGINSAHGGLKFKAAEAGHVFYVDNVRQWCFPVDTIFFVGAANGTEITDVKIDGDTYTFPTPDTLGYPTENFIKWVSIDGTKKYSAGETVSGTAVGATSFYPFYQDVSAPAMALAFEGTTLANSMSKFKYQENLIDDGRTVLHLRQNGSSWGGASSGWMSDARISLLTGTPFATAEYNQTEYVMRVADAKNPASGHEKDNSYTGIDAVNVTNAGTIGYLSVADTIGGTYSYLNPVEQYLGSYAAVNNGDYVIVSVNGSASTTFLDKPYSNGLYLDPYQVKWSSDIYLDYFRIYRFGILSVTYMMNDGTDTVFRADQNRGAGTGYALTGARPTRAGYHFLGWSTAADGDIIDTIDLTADTTLYAIWETEEEATQYTPTSTLKNGDSNIMFRPSLGANDPIGDGLRFISEVSDEAYTNANQIGLIITRKYLLDAIGVTANDFTHTLRYPKAGASTALPYAEGIVYNDGTDGGEYTSRPYDVLDDGTVRISGVAYNIKDFSETLIARPYLRFTDRADREITLYGDPIATTMDDVKEYDDERDDTDAYLLVDALNANTWQYDNKNESNNKNGSKTATVTDNWTDRYAALYRDFDPEDSGTLTLNLYGTIRSEDDGAVIGFADATREFKCGIQTVDGTFHLIGTGDTDTGIACATTSGGSIALMLYLDLDNHTMYAKINNNITESVEIPDTAYRRLILGTTKSGTGSVAFSQVRLIKNYQLFEDFTTNAATSSVPEWRTEGSVSVALNEANGGSDRFSAKITASAGSTHTATREIEDILTDAAYEVYMLLPEKRDGAAFSLMSGTEAVFTVETKNGAWYVGETKLREYQGNVWQCVRIETNPAADTAVVKICGKTLATDVPFTADYVDAVKVSFAPSADGVLWFDDVKAYHNAESANYPSAPVSAQDDNYNIGVNVCNLWRDGQNGGDYWDEVSPFADLEPVMGYYDEGTPEAADWEIKYMVEHGIDFQHMCWYCPFGVLDRPLKRPANSAFYALHDGFMNAKYSDMMSFCIMWENSGGHVDSLETFENYLWPYWKEYYFTDPRYLSLDNKAVITVWSIDKFRSVFANEPGGCAAAIAFMREDIKTVINPKTGEYYDDMIILASSQGSLGDSTYNTYSTYGFDGTYAYHYGANGMYSSTQISVLNANKRDAEAHGMHNIPTVSVGFNNVGRGSDNRKDLISVADHLTVCEYIKDMLPNNTAANATWKDKTVMISTWNEFSEGTYVAPAGVHGFDYLDNIRATFTANTAHTDVAPTAAQKEEISHLFYEGTQPIRHYGYEKRYDPSSVSDFTFTSAVAWNMANSTDRSKWGKIMGYTALSSTDSFKGISTSGDPAINLNAAISVIAAENQYVHIRLKSDTKTGFELFFTNNEMTQMAQSACVSGSITKTGEYVDYYLDMATNANWKGTITKLRLDPVTTSGATFEIALVEIGNPGGLRTFEVNYTGIDFTFYPEYDEVKDEYIVTANPNMGFFSMLGLYYEWDRFSGALRIESNDHVLLCTENSQTATLDGETVDLGIPMTLHDGLPVFCLKRFCGFFGYIVHDDTANKIVNIQTVPDDVFAAMADRLPNQWEFEVDGDMEGFTSGNSSLSVENGLLYITAGGNDPSFTQSVSFKASQYDRLVIGVVGDKTTLASDLFQFFFTTSSATTETESKSYRHNYNTANMTNGGIYEFTFDLTENTNWSGTLRSIRFDPFNGRKSGAVAYIRFEHS